MRTVKAPGARQALTTSHSCRAIHRPRLSARAAVPAGGIAGEGVVDAVSVIENRAHGPVAGSSDQAPHVLPQPGQVDRAGDIDGRSGRLQRIRAGQIRWNAVFIPTAGGAIDKSFSS
jgi:hypothetical protein